MLNSTKTKARWAVVRKSTGSLLKSLSSRSEARAYRRTRGTHLTRIWDTENQMFVR